jgi:hypothetical protein
MLLVAAPLGLPNIINNHLPDPFAAMLAGQKVLSERCSSDFGDLFVLRDGEHFLFRQAAERNAVFKRNHAGLPHERYYSITSSANASSLSGTARSSMRAVCALITSSNFEACTTGRSAGFAPLRTRPTWVPI